MIDFSSHNHVLNIVCAAALRDLKDSGCVKGATVTSEDKIWKITNVSLQPTIVQETGNTFFQLVLYGHLWDVEKQEWIEKLRFIPVEEAKLCPDPSQETADV